MNPEDEKRKAIISRISQHLDAVIERHPAWVGIFLQGSQNYNLDDDESDVDTKLIVLPSFEDVVLNRKPHSYTHVMENGEHCDVKDIRLMFDCFRKQNINFVEILFTKYFIMNPEYERFFYPVIEARERIGRYNVTAALNCMVGMCHEKRKALTHRYPTTEWKIDKYGYDSKQWQHIFRLHEFMGRYLWDCSYADCLISERRELLLDIKRYRFGDLTYALASCDGMIMSMEYIRDSYKKNYGTVIDHGVDQILNQTLLNLFKAHFLSEIGG